MRKTNRKKSAVKTKALRVPTGHPSQKGMRSIIIGIFVNGILAIIKGVAGFLGNSYALIADAIESSLDVLTSFIVWNGLKIASKPPDEDHPYGHGKAEPLTATIVALVLVGAAIIIAIQSIKEIITPHHAPAPFTLLVLAVVVITKEALFRFVQHVGNTVNSIAVKTDAWHHRSDALTSAAAFVGISVALIGGKGYESADDWAALLASFIIVYNAWKLLTPAIGELMDASPSSEINHEVRRVAKSVLGVVAIEKCFVRKIGFDYYVDLHVIVDGRISVSKGHAISHRVKDTLRHANERIANVLIHIEPNRKSWYGKP
ncbi:cation transporter [Candidatus Woesearchaeota archaeon]|nr:cation transporter [Candidatus Woesearchaeota archaeon]